MLSAEPKVGLITLSETLNWLFRIDITKTESNHRFIVHCFEENNDRHRPKEPELISLLEIMHCACNLQISQLSASR